MMASMIMLTKGRPIPLWEHSALVEHQVARCDDRDPVDHWLGQVGPRIRLGMGNAVVVHSIGDQRRLLIFAGLHQVQLIAATRAMFRFPQPSIRPKRPGHGGDPASSLFLGKRQIGPGKVYVRTTGAVLAALVSDGGSMTGTGCAGLVCHRIARPVCYPPSAAAVYRAAGWDPARRHALPVANCEEEIFTVRREGDFIFNHRQTFAVAQRTGFQARRIVADFYWVHTRAARFEPTPSAWNR